MTAKVFPFYIFIERDGIDHVVVGYPSLKAAQVAMVESPLIDTLCAENCLDAYIVSANELLMDGGLPSDTKEKVEGENSMIVAGDHGVCLATV